MKPILFLAAAAALSGCDRPAPPPLEKPRAEEEFSGFQTSGTPLAPSSPPQEIAAAASPVPAQAPTQSLTHEARAAIEDYAKAVRDLHTGPALPANFDAIRNPGALQSLNNAITGHVEAVKDAGDRARAAMNPQQRKAWATRKKEIDDGEQGE